MTIPSAARLPAWAFLLGMLVAPAGRSEPDSAPQHPDAPGIQRERVYVVLVDVVATDSSGRPVTDLRPEEFTLMVDGRHVKIQSVDLEGPGAAGEAGPPVGTAPEEPAPASGTGGTPPISPPGPAAAVPRPRGIVFFFDGLNREIGLGREPIDSARRLIKAGLAPGDEVMVIGLGRECRIYQQFTSDPALALAALDEVEKDPGIRTGGENRFLRNLEELKNTNGDPGLAQLFASEDRRRITRTLSALRAMARILRARPGRKEVFLFTDGFPGNFEAFYHVPFPTGMEPELMQVAREVGAAQAALDTVNTQGLIADPPEHPKEILEQMSTNALVSLSLGSGGVATHGINRAFERPLGKIEAQTRFSYVLAYAPEGEPDGKPHSIRVGVTRKGIRIRAPEGFVWMTGAQRRESETESAFFVPELFSKIPLVMEASSYLGADGKPRTRLVVAVPFDSLLFLPGEGHRTARLEAGLVVDPVGGGENPPGRTVEVRRPDREGEDAGTLTLLFRRAPPPGDYRFTAVVRDLQSGEVGAIRLPAKVPPLVADHLAMSSLILSRADAVVRRIDLDPPGSDEPEFPLPALPRVFTPSDRIAAFSLVHHPRPDPKSGEVRVSAFARIERGGEVVRRFDPARQHARAAESAATLTVKIPIDLSGMEPGRYTLEVEAWDEVEQRGIIQRAEFLVR